MTIQSPWGSIEESQYMASYAIETVTLYAADAVQETDGCALPFLSIDILPDGSVIYKSMTGATSGVDIGGFQFQVNFEGAVEGETYLTGAAGGSAEEMDFMIMSQDNLLMAFTIGGTPILQGCGVLVNAEFAAGATPTSISEIVISDAAGNQIDFISMDYAIGPNDWVGAFKGSVCVGARQWDTSLCNNGICSVPVFGKNDLDPNTNGYMLPGDIPIFKMWSEQEDISYAAGSYEEVPGYEPQGTFFIKSLEAQQYSYTYFLPSGFNLIGIPYNMPNSSIPVLFPQSTAGYSPIIGILGQGIAAAWSAISGEDGLWIGSLTSIDYLAGYWFSLQAATNMSVVGGPIGNPIYTLEAGFNLVSYPGAEDLAVVDAFPADVVDDINSISGQNISAMQQWTCQCDPGTAWLSGECADPGLGLYDDPIVETFQFDFGAGSSGDVNLGVWGMTGPVTPHEHAWPCKHRREDRTIYGATFTEEECSYYVANFGAIWYGFYDGTGECSNPDLPVWDSGSDISLQNCIQTNGTAGNGDYGWNCTNGVCTGWVNGGITNSLTIFDPATLGASSCQAAGLITGNQLIKVTYYDDSLKCTNYWNHCWDTECEGYTNGGLYLGCDLGGECTNNTCSSFQWNYSEMRQDRHVPECNTMATDCGSTADVTCTPDSHWIGSLMKFEPQKGYWITTSDNLSFQFNLTEVARCSDRDFTDQQTCEGSGNFWRSRLMSGGTGSSA